MTIQKILAWAKDYNFLRHFIVLMNVAVQKLLVFFVAIKVTRLLPCMHLGRLCLLEIFYLEHLLLEFALVGKLAPCLRLFHLLRLSHFVDLSDFLNFLKSLFSFLSALFRTRLFGKNINIWRVYSALMIGFHFSTLLLLEPRLVALVFALYLWWEELLNVYFAVFKEVALSTWISFIFVLHFYCAEKLLVILMHILGVIRLVE
jgi:hypothetical protein